MSRITDFLIVLFSALAMTQAESAGEADVVGVKVSKEAGGTYSFDVSVRHADSGWDHFANRWEVLGPDGAVLGTRELAHPHETEQPFTRSLTGVKIPPGVTEVTLRAHDSVHGLGGAEMKAAVPK